VRSRSGAPHSTRRSSTGSSMVRYGLVHHVATHYSTPRCSKVHLVAAQYTTLQHSTPCCNSNDVFCCNTVEHVAAQRKTPRSRRHTVGTAVSACLVWVASACREEARRPAGAARGDAQEAGGAVPTTRAAAPREREGMQPPCSVSQLHAQQRWASEQRLRVAEPSGSRGGRQAAVQCQRQ
jgi:hypothetical protein